MSNKVSSIYLHFPYCISKCHYCDFFRQEKLDNDWSEYHHYLDRSLVVHSKFLSEHDIEISDLKTLYIGGGTPSLWGIDGISYLQQWFMRMKIGFCENYEATIEVNPTSLSTNLLTQWRDLGINRISVGVQSMNDEHLKILGRIHRFDEVDNLLQVLKKEKINYSVDLMIGLPFSGTHKRDIVSELKKVFTYNPSHISLYILTPKENYKDKEYLPDDHLIAEEYFRAVEILKENGFEHYEVSNFSLPGKRSMHNMLYWESKSCLAFGPSSTGYLSEKRIRYKWDNHDPLMTIEHLTSQEQKLESFYLRMRTAEGVNPTEYFQGEDLKGFKDLVRLWEKRGMVYVRHGNITLTSEGFILWDGLMDEVFSTTKSL